MTRPKPTLGYPSRTEAVVALRAKGVSVQEVARRLEITAAAVTALEWAAYRAKGFAALKLPAGLVHRLTVAAKLRGQTASEFSAELLRTIIDDDLIDAVLDEGSA